MTGCHLLELPSQLLRTRYLQKRLIADQQHLYGLSSPRTAGRELHHQPGDVLSGYRQAHRRFAVATASMLAARHGGQDLA